MQNRRVQRTTTERRLISLFSFVHRPWGYCDRHGLRFTTEHPWYGWAWRTCLRLLYVRAAGALPRWLQKVQVILPILANPSATHGQIKRPSIGQTARGRNNSGVVHFHGARAFWALVNAILSQSETRPRPGKTIRLWEEGSTRILSIRFHTPNEMLELQWGEFGRSRRDSRRTILDNVDKLRKELTAWGYVVGKPQIEWLSEEPFPTRAPQLPPNATPEERA